MSVHRERWPEGTPGWVDLAVRDVEAARRFYTGLFGWDLVDTGPDYGNYLIAHVGGEPVAGVGPLPPGMAGTPCVWTTYLAVDEVDATAGKVGAAGGQLVVPAGDVGDSGRMAIATDPTGAAFGLWQAGTNTGANRVNEHGCMIWNEVAVTDYEAARRFYTEVFGYTYEDLGDERFTYATVAKDGRTVAGIGVVGDMGPSETPSHWRTYFAVDDMTAALKAVADLGGTVLVDPWETPFGTMAPVQGPNGEALVLNQPTPPAS